MIVHDAKPCPFCATSIASLTYDLPLTSQRRGRVFCHGCATYGPVHLDPVGAWNHRPTPTEDR